MREGVVRVVGDTTHPSGDEVVDAEVVSVARVGDLDRVEPSGRTSHRAACHRPTPSRRPRPRPPPRPRAPRAVGRSRSASSTRFPRVFRGAGAARPGDRVRRRRSSRTHCRARCSSWSGATRVPSPRGAVRAVPRRYGSPANGTFVTIRPRSRNALLSLRRVRSACSPVPYAGTRAMSSASVSAPRPRVSSLSNVTGSTSADHPPKRRVLRSLCHHHVPLLHPRRRAV